MPDIFDTFAELYQGELDKPELDDGGQYPAVLVDGPTRSTMLDYLHYNPVTGSMGIWFTFVADKTGQGEFSKRANLVTVKHYLFLGMLDTTDTDGDRVKQAFLNGEVNFAGTPGTALRNLRYALYDNEALKEMGRAKYNFDDFLFRQVQVTIKHSPNKSGGAPYTNIGRIQRFEDLMGNIGPKVAPEDVAWQPREDRDNSDGGGLF